MNQAKRTGDDHRLNEVVTGPGLHRANVGNPKQRVFIRWGVYFGRRVSVAHIRAIAMGSFGSITGRGGFSNVTKAHTRAIAVVSFGSIAGSMLSFLAVIFDSR